MSGPLARFWLSWAAARAAHALPAVALALAGAAVGTLLSH